MKKFVFQGSSGATQRDIVTEILRLPDLGRALIGIAYLTSRGVDLLGDDLKAAADRTTIIAGVRNGVTTAQGLMRTLELGCTTYAVDTGGPNPIYHPKVFISTNEARGLSLIGSANLTVSGLTGNVEAGTYLGLDLNHSEDEQFVKDVWREFEQLQKSHPENMVQIRDASDINRLFEMGCLRDEAKRLPSSAAGTSTTLKHEKVPPIKLNTPRLAMPSVKQWRSGVSEDWGGPFGEVVYEEFTHVWRIDSLVERDLSIPKNKGSTKLTGSMLLKKGNNDIDTKTYFREDVFAKLNWGENPRKPDRGEIAIGRFRIIKNSVEKGVFNLVVTHDFKMPAKSQAQFQPPGSLRWGSASTIVRDPNLLGRALDLYRSNMEKDMFLIEFS